MHILISNVSLFYVLLIDNKRSDLGIKISQIVSKMDFLYV
jgi:hypothetical protein